MTESFHTRSGVIVSLAILLQFHTVPLSAQTVTSYTLKIFNQGAPAPLTTTVLPATNFVCNQPQPASTTNTANPTTIAFNDPLNAGQACLYVDPGTGPLFSLPFGTGTYTATVAATNSVGTSADSAVSNPFTRPGVVAAVPTAVRVYR